MQKAPVDKSLLRLLVEAADAAERILRDNFAGTPLHGVTRAQITVFRELEQGGPATASDLARTIGVTGQAMGECVRRLESHGLVEVTPDPQDSRARIVSISPLGSELLGSVWERLSHIETRLASIIGTTELSELKQSLALIPELRQTSDRAGSAGARRR